MKTEIYTYSILQYIPSQVLGEAVNVGILCIFPDQKQVFFNHPSSLTRVRDFYPAFPESLIKSYLKGFGRKSSQISKQWNLFADAFIEEGYAYFISREFLVNDGSALQFSEPKTGLLYTSDLAVIVNDLQELYLGGFEEGAALAPRRNEKFILKSYKGMLFAKDQSIEKYLQPNYAIKSEKSNISFDIAWQNKSLHLVKPLSFDLSHPKAIEEKAQLYYAKFSLLSELAQTQGYTFDLLVSRPQKPELQINYRQALAILRDSQAPQSIIEENQWEVYTQKTVDEIVKTHTAP